MAKVISFRLLRISIGIFFVILGIIGVLPNVQESIFSFSDQHYGIEALFGIVEIICGLLLVMGLFTFMKRTTVRRASLIVLIVWGVRIIFAQFVWGIRITSGIFFLPSISTWLLVLSCELVIMAALFLIYRAYD